jgi:hypothetical protein
VKPKANWKTDYDVEIKRGQMARSDGNEAMARVCARRAAGIIIGEYLRRKGIDDFSNSAYKRIALFESLPEVDQQYKEVASHCLLKVEPDRRLPIKVDLLAEVIWLKNTLLLDANNDYTNTSDHQ